MVSHGFSPNKDLGKHMCCYQIPDPFDLNGTIPRNIEDWASIVPILALFQAAQFHVSMYFRVRDNSDCKVFIQKFNYRMEEKGVQSSFSTTCFFLWHFSSWPHNQIYHSEASNKTVLVSSLVFLFSLSWRWIGMLSKASVFRPIADQAKFSGTVFLESKWRSIKREIQTSPETIIVNKIQKIDPTLARFNCKCSKVSEEKCFFALKAGLCHKKTLSKMRARFITRHHVSKQSKPCNPSVLYNPKKQT